MNQRRSLAVVLASVVSAVGCNETDLSAGALLVDDGRVEQGIHRVCPDGETTYGIDVSYYQGTIDWAAAKAGGVQFAIARVSDGTGFRDPQFAANWSGTKANGIVRGAYQFFRSDDDPIEQANLMIEMMGTLEPGDLPPVADVESTDGVSNATRAQRLQQWLDRIEEVTGVVPMIYTGGYFWQDNVGRDFSRYPLWHAGYTGGTCPSTIADQWPGYTFWQFGSTGRVAGISGNVDENRFNGTLADLQRFAHSNRVPRGYIDAATCDAVVGWAQDEDTKDVAIDVHLYVDGAFANVASAGIARDDLCNAIGSCNHGYSVALPNSFKDGVDHTVVVWGIDDQGQNTPLSGSGAVVRCDAPALPAGVLRHITSPDVMSAWHFSFSDITPYTDAALAADAIGDVFAAAPRLVRGDGDNAVYVVDADGSRRHVQNPTSLAAWRFDAAAIEVLALADVEAMALGQPLPLTPILVRGEGPAVYVIDVEPAAAVDPGQQTGDPTDDEGNNGGVEGDPADDEAVDGDDDGSFANQKVRIVTANAKGCSSTPTPPLFIGLLLLLLRRRR